MIRGMIKSAIVRKLAIPVIVSVLFLSLVGVALAQSMPSWQACTIPDYQNDGGSFQADAWMLQSDGQTVADCLGQTFSQYGNKTMQEMINFVYVDPYAKSQSDAYNRFNEAVAGGNTPFGQSVFHTGGYTSYIAGALYQQQPSSPENAWADKSWYNTNIHHFRTFGAYYYNGAWYTLVATSTESYIWYEFTHVWTSFNTSRDVLDSSLLNSTINPGFKELPNLNLGNQIPASNPTLSTGDFDGKTDYILSPANINMNTPVSYF